MTQLAVVTSQEPEVRSHSGYRLIIEPGRKRVRVVLGGETVAESDRVLVMHETGYRPVVYIPREDVRMELMRPSALRTHCPFKGDASYWTVEIGGRRVEDVAWSYEDPYEEAAIVRGHIAFYWDRIDAWFEDDEQVVEPPPPTRAATANPLLDWVTREAWRATTAQELIERLALRLAAAGFPLWRLRLLIRTLHPQLFATALTWRSDAEGVETTRPSYAMLQSRAYLDSPFAPILRGEGGVRRRLEGPQPRLDYPVLEELHATGATDYVAMPLRFSDGQINIITLVSREAGGFSTAQLGLLYEILPVLSRLFEVFALQDSAATLLGTYLGRRTGSEVLNGLIRRGDGRDIDAAIWLCDLRDSTVLSESMSREAYLESLNQFFDCMVEPIVEHGGEVLKYIGDAVLAIFPIEEPDSPAHEACARALAAAADARARVEQLNRERGERAEPPLAYGIGLHRGSLTYGNIGSADRLDFTIVGTAVNQVARIENLTKILRVPLLISSAFAASFGGELIPLGRHQLRGVALPQEIFTA
jgi:adenylate cyclase